MNNAAIHEFGHMIGNPDEYQLSQAHYTATVGTNPTTDPNATATPDTAGTNSFTNTNSVMGGMLPGTNLPGPVQMRHVQFMLTWLNTHRNPGEPAVHAGHRVASDDTMLRRSPRCPDSPSPTPPRAARPGPTPG